MSEENKLVKEYGELGKAIQLQIEQSAKEALYEMFEPIRILKGFEDKDVLTLAEVVQVLRLRNVEQAREAAKRGDIPVVTVGRDYLFPKRLIADYLLGKWKKTEKETRSHDFGKDVEAMAARFVGDS